LSRAPTPRSRATSAWAATSYTRLAAEGTRSAASEDAEALRLGQKVGTVSEDAKLPILQQVRKSSSSKFRKTFDFFRASTSGEHIEKIYLAGVGENPRVARSIAPGFSLPVEVF